MINLVVDGTGTLSASGFDQHQVDSVVDNGTGDYTIIFKSPFERACQVAGLVMVTADAIANIDAVAYDRVTITCFDSTDGTTPKDAAFHLCIIGSDARYDV